MKKFVEPNEVLRDCTERFERLGIPYMLTGSMAMVYYAQPRMTADIDIVVELSTDSAEKLIAEFEPDYYVPAGLVREAIRRNSMFNLIHNDTIFKIDCIITKNDDFARVSFSRRRRVNYSGFELWISSQEDVILSKLMWAKKSDSERQLRDVANLMRTDYDTDYVKKWSGELGVGDLLNKVREDLQKENAG